MDFSPSFLLLASASHSGWRKGEIVDQVFVTRVERLMMYIGRHKNCHAFADNEFFLPQHQLARTSHDEIQLGGPSARITGALLTNSGVISGDGRIDVVINNSPTGEFRSSLSERLVFTASSKINDGSITTTDG